MTRRASLLLLLLSLGLSAGCITEEDVGPMVVLPPEAYRYERFIESPTELSADRVLIEAVRAYRRDLAPIIDEDFHTKEITPDRITLRNRGSQGGRNPVSVSFRNMRIQAREQIEVVFSDVPLLKEQEQPPILLMVANGVAHFRGDGLDVTADRIVLRNHEIKSYLKDGREIPVRGGSR
ncbi:MAG: hypothetical protein V2A76_16510 [Planctomycetota bacterium]